MCYKGRVGCNRRGCIEGDGVVAIERPGHYLLILMMMSMLMIVYEGNVAMRSFLLGLCFLLGHEHLYRGSNPQSHGC